MDVHADPFQQAGLFQRLAAAQHGVADDGVVLPQKARRQGLPKCLLFQEAQRAEAAVGEKGLIGQAQAAGAALQTAHLRSPAAAGCAAIPRHLVHPRASHRP